MLAVLQAIRSYLGFAVLAALLWAAGHFLPMFNRVAPEHGYSDMNGVDPYSAVTCDNSLSPRAYRMGDLVAYRTENEGMGTVCFARVVARPGQVISIVAGKLHVDGQEQGQFHLPQHTPDLAPLPVPEGHLWLVSDYNEFDSFRFGPIPAALLHGRTAG